MSFSMTKHTTPGWAKWTLILAGFYNMLFGAWVVFFPNMAFELTGMQTPLYPQIWSCVGMIVGVYGLGYLLASMDPARHWIIVLVGFLGKIFGPIGFVYTMVTTDVLSWSFGAILITNDLIWWVPFAMILYNAMFRNQDQQPHKVSEEEAVKRAFTNDGECLLDISMERQAMLVFLRHTGCTFCTQALNDLAEVRESIEKMGPRIVLVHMSQPEEMDLMLKQYGIEDMAHISDPNCMFYESLGLDRANVFQAFGPSVWLPGIKAFMMGNRIGPLRGDGFRLPGVFIVDKGKITNQFKPRDVAFRPDYRKLAGLPMASKSNSSDSDEQNAASTVFNPRTTG